MHTETDPTEDRPDMDLPGADGQGPQVDPQGDLPQRLGERIEGGPSGIATGAPDLLPDAEVPEGQM